MDVYMGYLKNNTGINIGSRTGRFCSSRQDSKTEDRTGRVARAEADRHETILRCTAQAWFAPLVKTSSPLLENFPTFLAELEATYGVTNRRRTTLTKLYTLEQGLHATSVYASEFRQLACDVNWDDQALVDNFQRGFRSNVKNLLLNFPEPTSLSQPISQAVHFSNFARKSMGLGGLVQFHDMPR